MGAEREGGGGTDPDFCYVSEDSLRNAILFRDSAAQILCSVLLRAAQILHACFLLRTGKSGSVLISNSAEGYSETGSGRKKRTCRDRDIVRAGPPNEGNRTRVRGAHGFTRSTATRFPALVEICPKRSCKRTDTSLMPRTVHKI